MTYHGKVRNYKVNFKDGKVIIEVEFPAKSIITEAKKDQRSMEPKRVSLEKLVVKGFKRAAERSSIRLTF